ncbi:hypothetical protein Pan216_13280 [Planctomycetes bacterium Pan216]|uniref:Uncharacterized protein n=1 Tax=Kolteria novifilia TaxID=2527975 RepID=A0A518B0I9_9BACT|nr:hypothetical protein Pan216_13280 [Planctomycetes bacterium Pan216]
MEAASHPLSEPSFLQQFFEPGVMPFAFTGVVLLLLAIVAVSWIGFHYWNADRRHQREVAFKHELIDRGVSTEEIIRIIESGSSAYKRPEQRSWSDDVVRVIEASKGKCAPGKKA